MESTIIKVLMPAFASFAIGIAITPAITHYLFKYKVWKKSGGKTALNGTVATEFNRIKGAGETKTPRMGGIVIWASVGITVLSLYLLSMLFDGIWDQLNFLSRGQTWIPLCALFIGAGLGFWNDYYDVTHRGREITVKVRLVIISTLAAILGWWFYSKLGVTSVGVPLGENLEIGWLTIPLFVALANMLYASGVIDGIDGLSGGVFASVFTAYAAISYSQSQFDIATLSATIAGAILAFLWFNIPPARFWMTETGSMSLTLALSVIVFMTDSLGDGYGLSLLFIAGLPLVATVISNVLQVGFRRTAGRKLFRIAPLHHHFEAIGWSSEKVTMRYWIISIICALLSVIVAGLL